MRDTNSSKRDIIGSDMPKRVVDLTPQDLNSLASEAWADAAQKALAAGRAIVGSRDGRLLRYHPNGAVEDLGPVESIDRNHPNDTAKSRKSVA
jgi:hypothetical protein